MTENQLMVHEPLTSHSSINFRTSVSPLHSAASISSAALSVGISPDDRLINFMLSEIGFINNEVIRF